jgi:hypothetical protein
MPLDKAALGDRFVCFECETRFYDLNRPEPTCPSCGVNQRELPGEGAAKEPAPAAAKEAKTAAPEKEATSDPDTEELADANPTKDSDDVDDDDEEDGGLSELGVPEMGESDEETEG